MTCLHAPLGKFSSYSAYSTSKGSVKEPISHYQCCTFYPIFSPSSHTPGMGRSMFLDINLHVHHPSTVTASLPTYSSRCLWLLNSRSTSTKGFHSCNVGELCAVIVAILDPCLGGINWWTGPWQCGCEYPGKWIGRLYEGTVDRTAEDFDGTENGLDLRTTSRRVVKRLLGGEGMGDNWIKTENGWLPRWISYLAELRNMVLEPLSDRQLLRRLFLSAYIDHIRNVFERVAARDLSRNVTQDRMIVLNSFCSNWHCSSFCVQYNCHSFFSRSVIVINIPITISAISHNRIRCIPRRYLTSWRLKLALVIAGLFAHRYYEQDVDTESLRSLVTRRSQWRGDWLHFV